MTHAPATSVKKKEGEEEDEYEIVAPDGGWGWWVVFASFSIHIVTDGLTYTLGLFYVEFQTFFKSSAAETAWIVSILVGVTLCSGPFSSAFVNKYGCRAVTIAGTVIAGVCLILSVFATNIFTLYVTIGLGTGFGLGMIYLPAIVSVTVYFEKLRSLATGIAVCGSGFGTAIFAPIVSYLIKHYNWQGAFLVIAGIVFCCSVFGYMFRPLLPTKKVKTEPLLENGNNNNNNKYQVSDVKFNNELLKPDDGLIPRSRSIGNDLVQNGGSVVVPNDSKSNGRKPLADDGLRLALSQPLLSQGDSSERRSLKSSQYALDRPDVFYQGSLHNISRYRSRGEISSDDKYGSMGRNVQLSTTSQQLSHHEPSQVCGCVPCSEETKNTLQKMMSFGLLKNPIFIIFSASNFLTSVGFYIPYVYLAAYAEKINMTKTDGSNLIAIIGVANLIGRVILGYIADKPWVNRLLIYNACLTICGIATAFAILCTSFWTLAIYSTVFGFTIGAYVGLTSVILVDLLGIESLTNAFGLLLLFQGVASFIGSPLGGVIYDFTDSYDWVFIMAGVTIAISGIMLVAIPPLLNRMAKREAKKNINNLSMVPL